MTELDKLLTAEEVGEMLHLAPEVVWRWGARGVLPRVVLSGRATRYRLSDIEAFIESRREAISSA